MCFQSFPAWLNLLSPDHHFADLEFVLLLSGFQTSECPQMTDDHRPGGEAEELTLHLTVCFALFSLILGVSKNLKHGNFDWQCLTMFGKGWKWATGRFFGSQVTIC